MIFLINCSNLKLGGGVQVADSVCCQLHRHMEHRFVVVLSSYMSHTRERLQEGGNVIVVEHDIQNNLSTLLFGKDKLLDALVDQYQVQAVLTIFGPPRWNPRVPHLCGFAKPHLVMPESPFFTEMSKVERLRWRLRSRVLTYFFHRSADAFWTENPYISERLSQLLGGTSEFNGGGING